ncbi:MAG: hypothetical protein Q4P66_09645 [Actinomycetaceae bacterium]|nr:hypothetical protein [Actinomycetaceae bacterium]
MMDKNVTNNNSADKQFVDRADSMNAKTTTVEVDTTKTDVIATDNVSAHASDADRVTAVLPESGDGAGGDVTATTILDTNAGHSAGAVSGDARTVVTAVLPESSGDAGDGVSSTPVLDTGGSESVAPTVVFDTNTGSTQEADNEDSDDTRPQVCVSDTSKLEDVSPSSLEKKQPGSGDTHETSNDTQNVDALHFQADRETHNTRSTADNLGDVNPADSATPTGFAAPGSSGAYPGDAGANSFSFANTSTTPSAYEQPWVNTAPYHQQVPVVQRIEKKSVRPSVIVWLIFIVLITVLTIAISIGVRFSFVALTVAVLLIMAAVLAVMAMLSSKKERKKQQG